MLSIMSEVYLSTSTGSYRLGTRLETATIISSGEDASNIEMPIFASMIEVVDVFRWGSTPDESEVTLRRDTNPQTVISGVVSRAKLQHDKYIQVMATACREIPGSRRLERHALSIAQLANRAQKAPCTHFMPDIARGVLQVMKELLLYAEYEAGHPIFRLMRDMGRDANVLEGKMQALQVLMEAEMEWKQKQGRAVWQPPVPALCIPD